MKIIIVKNQIAFKSQLTFFSINFIYYMDGTKWYHEKSPENKLMNFYYWEKNDFLYILYLEL